MTWPLKDDFSKDQPIASLSADWLNTVARLWNNISSDDTNVEVLIPAVPSKQNPVRINVTGGSGSGGYGGPFAVSDNGTSVAYTQGYIWVHGKKFWNVAAGTKAKPNNLAGTYILALTINNPTTPVWEYSIDIVTSDSMQASNLTFGTYIVPLASFSLDLGGTLSSLVQRQYGDIHASAIDAMKVGSNYSVISPDPANPNQIIYDWKRVEET